MRGWGLVGAAIALVGCGGGGHEETWRPYPPSSRLTIVVRADGRTRGLTVWHDAEPFPWYGPDIWIPGTTNGVVDYWHPTGPGVVHVMGFDDQNVQLWRADLKVAGTTVEGVTIDPKMLPERPPPRETPEPPPVMI